MIITCPNCQTRYQVAEKAIGSAGRKVLCANCAQSWQAVPEPDPPAPKPKLVKPAPKPESVDETEEFSADAEKQSDEAFEKADDKPATEEDAAADQADEDAPTDDENGEGELEPSLQSNRLRAMKARQKLLAAKFPMGRIRRTARLVGVGLLVAVIAGGVYFRTGIVRFAPDLAGVYESVGLGVNVVGLEFKKAQTLRALNDGSDTMVVTARIQNVTAQQVEIPPIVVTIVDDEGTSIYQWSAMAPARVLGAGEVVDFETQLTAPPEGAANVQLAFDSNGTN